MGNAVPTVDEIEQAIAVMSPQDRARLRQRLDAAEALERLREEVRQGIAELDAGLGRPWDPEEAKALGRKLLAEKRAQQDAA